MLNENWYPDPQLKRLMEISTPTIPLTGSIIEIGCWEGKSAMALAKVFAPETLVCCDTWLGNQAESQFTGSTHITEEILKVRDVYAIFLANMDEHTDKNYSVVKEDCLVWLQTYKEPIKFVHVDASHEYGSVKKTINLLKPLIVPGGMICGDDFINAGLDNVVLAGGVARAVLETLPGVKTDGNLWYWIAP